MRAPAAAPTSEQADIDGWRHLLELVQFGGLVTAVNTFLMTNMQCIGPSMLPTLGLSGDNVLMWPTSGLIRPKRGDVVVCASPTDPTSTVCKRIGGVPGDIMHFRRLPGMPAEHEGSIVPHGHCFLLGDNEWDSTDSRYYGPVPLALVKGIVSALTKMIKPKHRSIQQLHIVHSRNLTDSDRFPLAGLCKSLAFA